MRAANASALAEDAAAEADEKFQNPGEKEISHLDPDDPPRRRANKWRGHGNFANDRPPVVGLAGRSYGGLRGRVVGRTDRATL
jgi:transposase